MYYGLSTYFIPCWKTEFLLVLQMIKSAHCTTTILIKNAVWHVNSTIFLCSYVWKELGHVKTWDLVNSSFSVFHFTYPLLPVAIFQVIHIFVIPEHAYTQQCRRQESIFSQNYKVGKEASKCLNHTCERKHERSAYTRISLEGGGGISRTRDDYLWRIYLNSAHKNQWSGRGSPICP